VRLGLRNLLVLRTPFNRGYGGNQKLGYTHAIRRGIDYVVLLHGDGQYAPEYLPQIVRALGDGTADAVIASRMIKRLDALKGRMPLYKWVGNHVLTGIENKMLGSALSEFHSGYRAYKVETLRSIPFQLNSNGFHFDTEILIQLIQTGRKIVEIPVPTFYGDEISRVNGITYAFNCVKAVTKVRLSEVGLFYEPKFDFGLFEDTGYRVKAAKNSLHHHILSQRWEPTWHVADLGAHRGVLSAQIAPHVAHVTSADLERPAEAGHAEALAVDLDGDFDATLGHQRYDAVLALDVIEHLSRPEEGVRKMAAILKPGGMLYASTGNIAYFLLRISLLMGQFNYGKRGILDLTHRRLFTVYSFRRLLMNAGFVIKDIHGFGPLFVTWLGNAACCVRRMPGRRRSHGGGHASSRSTSSSSRRRRKNSRRFMSAQRSPRQRALGLQRLARGGKLAELGKKEGCGGKNRRTAWRSPFGVYLGELYAPRRVGSQRQRGVEDEREDSSVNRVEQPESIYGDVTYEADGLVVRGRNVEFLEELRFVEAYHQGMDSGHRICRPPGSRDDIHIEWRVHTICWAAHHAARLPGDFVECGVNTGIFSLAAAKYIDLNATGKRFYLFDTFAGIPEEQITEHEHELGRSLENDRYYEDCFEMVRRNFSGYPRAILVRGRVPDTLAAVEIDQVCYLSIDMNIVIPETAAMEHFWDKLVAGAPVILDDYGWLGYAPQKEAMDEFADGKGVKILTLPTGQGLLLKPAHDNVG
jgi:2-polyprenyl-3-methyl-5-hydroxy-6-metoxy-1,4-benzoquinol methylase